MSCLEFGKIVRVCNHIWLPITCSHMTEQPNIIFIITDQQRYDTINALGFPFVDTPNLDRLVREGVDSIESIQGNPAGNLLVELAEQLSKPV